MNRSGFEQALSVESSRPRRCFQFIQEFWFSTCHQVRDLRSKLTKKMDYLNHHLQVWLHLFFFTILLTLLLVGPGGEGQRGKHPGSRPLLFSDLVPRAQALLGQPVEAPGRLLQQIKLLHAPAQREELHVETLRGHGALHICLHHRRKRWQCRTKVS